MPATVFVQHHLPKELQVMPITLRIFERVGLWGSSWKPFFLCVIFLCYNTTIILAPMAFLGFGSDQFHLVAKGMAEFSFVFIGVAFTSIFAFHRGSFEEVVHGLSDIFHKLTVVDRCEESYAMITAMNKKLDIFTKIVIIYCINGGWTFSMKSVAISYWRYWMASSNGTSAVTFEMPSEQEFYGLQTKTNFTHYHIFVSFSFFAYFIVSFFSFVRIVSTVCLIKYSTLTYQLVIVQVQKLSQTSVKIDDLKDVVDLHRKAYNISTLVERICNVPIALEFLTCVLFWCSTMFYFTQSIDLKLFQLMLIFFISLVEIFTYSLLGSELSEQAAAVGRAFYELPWYDQSAEVQRYCRLIIQRTQRPTVITGVKFFVVELASFSGLVNLSYSYCLVLRNILDDQNNK